MSFPVKTLVINGVTVSVPHIRKKIRYSEGTEYVLVTDDVHKDPGQILAVIADRFYGDPELFTIILDNNPPLHDFFMEEGYKIFIPKLT